MTASYNDLLEFAIAAEQQSVRTYRMLADRALQPRTAAFFRDLAVEEQGHAAKLMDILEAAQLPERIDVLDLGVAQSEPTVAFRPELDYRDALVFAMQREAEAVVEYRALAASATNAAERAVFEMLANEEAKHKLSLEYELAKVDPDEAYFRPLLAADGEC